MTAMLALCCMATLTVRNLPEAVVQRLRERAAAAHRSLEEEVRRVLQRAADVDRDDFLAWVDERKLSTNGVDPVAEVRRDRMR